MHHSQSAVKVAVYWGDILYDTVLCHHASSISVGRKPGSTFLLDLDASTHIDSIEILKVRDDNFAELQFNEFIEGHVRLQKGLLTLGSAIKKNEAVKLPNGMYHLVLGEQDTAELVIGHVSFYIDWIQEAKPLPHSSILNWRNILFLLAFLSIAVPVGWMLQDSYQKIEEEKKPPERLVTLLPKVEKKLPPAPRKEDVKKEAPAEAALGERKTPDGGAQKGGIGKAPLVTPKNVKINKNTKIAKAPPAGRVTKNPAANATSAAQTIRNANLGSLVKGLASLGAEAPPPTNKEGYTAPIQQTGTGGFSTEGLKKGGGGKSVGIGRTVGQGEGGFEGTGRLGLSGTSIGAKGTGHGGGRAPSVQSGGLDREVIDNIVRQRKDRIRLCYERQLNFFPKLSGKLTVHFEIAADGNVLTSALVEDTMKNDKVRSGVLSEVATWTFPKPQGGVIVPVDYPFVFESSSHGGR